jgi:hypothetical protein
MLKLAQNYRFFFHHRITRFKSYPGLYIQAHSWDGSWWQLSEPAVIYHIKTKTVKMNEVATMMNRRVGRYTFIYCRRDGEGDKKKIMMRSRRRRRKLQ